MTPTLTVIEIDNFDDLPKPNIYREWIAAATLDDALRQVRRKLTGKVYHWKNCWAFEVTG